MAVYIGPRSTQILVQGMLSLLAFPPIRMLWERVDCEKGQEARGRPEAQSTKEYTGVGLTIGYIDFGFYPLVCRKSQTARDSIRRGGSEKRWINGC
jgi:hypothetical protein